MEWSLRQGLKFTFKHAVVAGLIALVAPGAFATMHDWLVGGADAARETLGSIGKSALNVSGDAVGRFTERVASSMSGGPEFVTPGLAIG